MLKEIQTKDEHKYCQECGSELLHLKISAEKVYEIGMFGIHYPHTKFNTYTGERQYGIRLKCPNKRWHNGYRHTDYSVFKNPERPTKQNNKK